MFDGSNRAQRTVESALTYSSRHILVNIFQSTYSGRHILVNIFQLTYSSQHILVNIFQSTYSCQYILVDIFQLTYSSEHIQGFHEMAKSFAQNLRYFPQIFLLRTFALFLRMKRNEFCAVLRYFFCAICAKPEIFFAKVAQETKFQFCAIFLRNLRKTASFTQNVTLQANCQKLIF